MGPERPTLRNSAWRSQKAVVGTQGESENNGGPATSKRQGMVKQS
jgi:hypothetical protein